MKYINIDKLLPNQYQIKLVCMVDFSTNICLVHFH